MAAAAGGARGPRRPPLHPAPLFDLPLLVQSLGELGKSADHARTIQKHALRSPRQPWDSICRGQDLPRAVIDMLEQDFVRTSSTVVEQRESVDGTVKMLIRLQDGLEVETVVIPMTPGYSTVCVSSQVGCAMGCTFCATGTMGLKGNLTAGEIVEQIVHARDACPGRNVRNVVFMGMGEPLHNYDAVITACRSLTDTKTFGMPHHSITVSTVGIVQGVRDLARDAPWVRLAFSLHSPEQEERQVIVPSARRYPLTEIIAALDQYIEAGGERVMVEYCVLRGKNDTEDSARRIGELLRGRRVVVNLIPYNPTDVTDAFQEPSEEAVEAMYRVLCHGYGLKCTIRKHHGRDIGGACGQLALQRAGGRVLSDIEDGAPAAAAPGGGGARLAEQRRVVSCLESPESQRRLGGFLWAVLFLVLAVAVAVALRFAPPATGGPGEAAAGWQRWLLSVR
eukprot:TRINITY_DN5885_c0_g1_i1.p1 TRINITY_DN5885_c0_g1~~TRINITY_DN5885_c0_g1_i1.p1  ORF type:complete len:485 (+),score=148.02 TRINITY_DN5885_c0_g1_i1:105-1457(+)